MNAPRLTMTGMYNVLEKLRSGETLTDKEKTIHEQGLVSVLKQIHEELDAAVFDAYGWPVTLTDEEMSCWPQPSVTVRKPCAVIQLASRLPMHSSGVRPIFSTADLASETAGSLGSRRNDSYFKSTLKVTRPVLPSDDVTDFAAWTNALRHASTICFRKTGSWLRASARNERLGVTMLVASPA